MLEIQDNRLDLKWICADGVVRDKFPMMKEVGKNTTYNIELEIKCAASCHLYRQL